MNLKAFYSEINGDYLAARERFFTDAMLLKFLKKFLEEPCCAELQDALDHHKRDAAIHAAHTLTGHARSFGFTELEKNSAALMQALRCEKDNEIAELRTLVTDCYHSIAHRICMLEVEKDSSCM